MALLKKLFKSNSNKSPKGFYPLRVSKVSSLTDDMVRIEFDTTGKESKFVYIPGQYLNFDLNINGKNLRRSYSICSGPGEDLAIGVKMVENGTASIWFNKEVKVDDVLNVAKPEGNFILKPEQNNVLCIAAGSGITPIVSIASSIEHRGGNCALYYGNRKASSIPFSNALDSLKNTNTNYFLSGDSKEGFISGRIDKDAFSEIVKNDLSLLKYDAYFLCGPEQMIVDIESVLKLFGVADDKIHYELFTTPVLMKSNTESDEASFEGDSKVKVILDDDSIEFNLPAKGKTILEKVNDEGFDAPYSCRGGVCCTCKAKVLEGKVSMTLNYALSDKEVEEGYILTCQSHPNSAEVTISYDE